MKLGVLIDRIRAEGGGAEAHTWALMERALAKGHEVVLALLEGDAPEGAHVLRIQAPRGRPERDEAFAERGVEQLRAAGCDVVFAVRHALACDVYLPHGGLVDEAREAKDRSRGGAGLGTRIARTFSRKHGFFQRAEAELLARVDGPLVIAVSEPLAERMRGCYPYGAHRVVTVLNGVDADRFTRAPFVEAGAALREKWGLGGHFVGLLLAWNPVLKGAEAAIRSLAESPVRELERPFALVVAGAALPSSLRRLARRLGVADRLREIGSIEDPRPVYAAADVLVHPTFYDPCSLVCLEALSMELPVITTPANGVRQAMGQRGGIVIEEPGNAEALAVAIRVLADDPLRAVTADDARYLALRNRERTRLDRVLDLCGHVAAAGGPGALDFDLLRAS